MADQRSSGAMRRSLRVGTHSRRRSRGFTLVELLTISLIVALGAVVALPKMLDLREEGYVARFDSAVGAFVTGVHLARASCRIRGTPGANTTDLPGFANGTVDFDDNCLPRGVSWSAGMPTTADCVAIFRATVPLVGVQAMSGSLGSEPVAAQGQGSPYNGCAFTDVANGAVRTVGGNNVSFWLDYTGIRVGVYPPQGSRFYTGSAVYFTVQ